MKSYGFDFDRQDEDVLWVREGKRTIPLFLEVYDVDFRVLEPALDSLAGSVDAGTLGKAKALAGRAKQAIFNALTGEGMESTHEEIRHSSVEYLYLLGPMALPALVGALRDQGDFMMRLNAARALGELGGEATVDALGGTGLKDRSWPVKHQCALELANQRDDKAEKYLREAVQMEEEQDKRELLRSLLTKFK